MRWSNHNADLLLCSKSGYGQNWENRQYLCFPSDLWFWFSARETDAFPCAWAILPWTICVCINVCLHLYKHTRPSLRHSWGRQLVSVTGVCSCVGWRGDAGRLAGRRRQTGAARITGSAPVSGKHWISAVISPLTGLSLETEKRHLLSPHIQAPAWISQSCQDLWHPIMRHAIERRAMNLLVDAEVTANAAVRLMRLSWLCIDFRLHLYCDWSHHQRFHWAFSTQQIILKWGGSWNPSL